MNKIAEKGGNGFYDWAHGLNGLGNGAKEFVDVLQVLTFRHDLIHTTLLNWGKVIPTRGLSRVTKAWCPACYQDWKDNNRVLYDPLIWSLQEISFCPIHSVPLCTHCPNPHCGEKIPWLNRCSKPGYCPKCRYWLGQTAKELSIIKEGEAKWEMFKYEMLGELIAFSPKQETQVNSPISILLKKCVQTFTDGNYAALSRRLDIPKTTIKSWDSGSMPSISSLLKLCYCLGITLLQLFTEQVDSLPLHQLRAPDIIPPKVPAPQNKDPQDVIEKALNNIVNQDEFPPPSVKSIASHLGYDRRLLSRRFPEQCKTISERYLAYQKKKGQERVERLSREVREATVQLFSKGIYPSRSKVEEFLGMPGAIKEQAIRSIWHQELEKLVHIQTR